MTDNPVTEAVTHMLRADNETDRCLAIGELLDRLVRSTGQRQDKIGPLAAALLLLWRVEHDAGALKPAEERARVALRRGDFNPGELIKLATTGRLLMGLALELQEGHLLAAVDAEKAEYMPQEGDLAIWWDKQVVRVQSVDTNEVHNDAGHTVTTITSARVLTARGQESAVSSKELKLYWRDDT